MGHAAVCNAGEAVSLIGFRAKGHPQQTETLEFGQESLLGNPVYDVDDRATTAVDFTIFDQRFHFDLDVAAETHNAKCERYFSPEQDGLAQAWAGASVWCNPPYSGVRPWVEKAWAEWRSETPPLRIVMLVPANRTEQTWWHQLVEPLRDRPGSDLHVEFLPGRMRFLRKGQRRIGPNERPPFGCCLLIWGER